MSFFRETIQPWIIEQVMSADRTTKQRHNLLADAAGNVLEIGFGTGLNLAFYPQKVKTVTVLEPNLGMFERAKERMANTAFPVVPVEGSAEAMPFDDTSFDTVVSTWTLCSISDPHRAVAEIYRVLKPGGSFLFVEHGLSNRERIVKLQNILNPLQKWWADGCNLNRDIKTIVTSQPFTLKKYKTYNDGGFLKTHSYTYQGFALKEKPDTL